ncbi:MAG: CoA transferase [Rhodospirillales bacterium]|nr:CoA transferase [Rhodospirillales bacterium]
MLRECLSGVRVLDLSQYIPGPFATLMLADLGAEVVKLEPPAGDPMRSFGPVDPDGIAAYYKLVNGGKTVLKLDLKTPSGARTFAELVSAADVLLESYRPGTLDRLGFDRARFENLNPALVHCALSGFGQTGPYRLAAGHDITYLASTGSLHVTGTDEHPVVPFPPVADHAGAMQAVVSILAALMLRQRTGKGSYLDVSLAEAALAWQYTTLARSGGGLLRNQGILNGGAAFYRVYRTADGRFVALGALEEKFWRNFCAAAGRPDLAPRHADPLPQTRLIAEVETLIATRTDAEWRSVLAGVDCCFEPVREPAEVPSHPQVAGRGLVHEMNTGVYEILFACHMNGREPQRRLPLRERTAEDVLREWRAA